MFSKWMHIFTREKNYTYLQLKQIHYKLKRKTSGAELIKIDLNRLNMNSTHNDHVKIRIQKEK